MQLGKKSSETCRWLHDEVALSTRFPGREVSEIGAVCAIGTRHCRAIMRMRILALASLSHGRARGQFFTTTCSTERGLGGAKQGKKRDVNDDTHVIALEPVFFRARFRPAEERGES